MAIPKFDWYGSIKEDIERFQETAERVRQKDKEKPEGLRCPYINNFHAYMQDEQNLWRELVEKKRSESESK